VPAGTSKSRNGQHPAGGRFLLVPAAVSLALVALSTEAVAARVQAVAETPRFHVKKPPRGTPVDVLALRIIYDSRRDVATAIGNVQITYGPYVLKARKVVYDRRKDRLYADGHVRLREPNGNVLIADYVNIDKRFRDGFARHLRLLMTNEATLRARYAVRRDGYLTIYEDVRYTRCKTCVLEDGTPVWELRSEQATHDERKRRIYHRNVRMEIGGTPVFWLPWLSHPAPGVKRATGFLVPAFGYSRQLGLWAEVPFFINLAPNYDLTLRPTFLTRQGAFLRAIWRHRLASGQYRVDIGGIRQLKPRRVAPPGDRKWRGHARVEGQFALNRRWSWGFDGTLLSDKTVMRRYRVDDRNIAESRLFITGLDGRNYLNARIAHYRGLLSSDDSETFPVATPYLDYDYVFPRAVLGGQLSLESSVYSIHRRKSAVPFTGVRQAEHQTRLSSTLSWQRRLTTAAGIVMQPFARLRSDVYITRLLPDPSVPGGMRDSETTARLLPSAGLDLRWPFMRMDDLGTHVISPVMQFVAARNETDTARIGNEDAVSLHFSASRLFLHDRFSGRDRFEGGVRINAGLLYTLFMPEGGFLRASVGQSYHLAGRNSFVAGSGLARDASDIVSALAFSPADWLRLSWQGRFDARSLSIRDQEASLRVSGRLGEAEVEYVRFAAAPAYGIPARQEQIFGRLSWNVRENWRLFGDWRYDLANSRNISRSVGIGFDCDCMSLSLAYRENFNRDDDVISGRSILFSVVFKTLAGGEFGVGGF
jgi:LPS-assembly protein